MDRSEITPERLRYVAGLPGPYTGRIRVALKMAADEIERLRAAADNFLHEQTEENANKLAAVLGGFPVRGNEQTVDGKS